MLQDIGPVSGVIDVLIAEHETGLVTERACAMAGPSLLADLSGITRQMRSQRGPLRGSP